MPDYTLLESQNDQGPPMNSGNFCDVRRFPKALLAICLLGCSWLGVASALAEDEKVVEERKRQFVQALIDAVKVNDRLSIAGLVDYPLRRSPPLQEVGNADELLIRFDEVFDEGILKEIANSDVDEDWASWGYHGEKGISFGQGDLWLDRKGKIVAVNHETAKTRRLISELNTKQRSSLHESVRQFQFPHLMWETEKFTIRIDQLENDVLRYVSWAKGKSMGEKPDLVLKNGKLEVEGTARNLIYRFSSGPYRYECVVIEMSPMDSVARRYLQVFKNDVEILYQPVLKVL